MRVIGQFQNRGRRTGRVRKPGKTARFSRNLEAFSNAIGPRIDATGRRCVQGEWPVPEHTVKI